MKLVQMITQRKSKSRSKSKSNENTIRDTYLSLTPYLCIAVIVITSLGIFMISDHSLTADTAVYTQWLEANSNNQVIKEGKYKIYANSENGITLVEPKNSNDKETPITLSDDPTPVRIVNFEREYWFKFTDLHREIKIMREHGMFFERNGTLLMATLHPAALLRNPKNKPGAMEDYFKLRDKINEVCERTY